ncbi:MAG: hypothetical protein ACREOG_04100, partial [Gemmatimonadaceae bacterium]
FGAGAEGAYGLLALSNYDPAGRLGVLAQGAYGQRRVWRGGSLGIAWRGWPAFDLKVHAFASQLGAARGLENPRFDGGALSLGRTFDFGSAAWTWHLAASAADVKLADSAHFRRRQALAELSYALRRSHGFWRQLQLRAQGAAGESGNTDVRRGIASLGATVAAAGLRLRLSATGGRTSLDPDSTSGAAAFEAFSFGGLDPPLFDDRLLPQRLSHPALPSATSSGRAFVAYSVALRQGGMPASLYADWFKVYDPSGNWQRLVGTEGDLAFPTIGFASLPNVALHYGAAYTIDHPRRHRWTFYGGARFAP